MKICALLSIITIQILCSNAKVFRNKHKYRTLIDDNAIIQPTCDINEEYLKCGNEYGRHCRDIIKPSEHRCSAKNLDCSDGCFCAKGFYRKDRNDLCVTKEECNTADKYQSQSGLEFYAGKPRIRRSNYPPKRSRYRSEYDNIEDQEQLYKNSVYEARKRRLKHKIYMQNEKRRQYMLSQVRHYYKPTKKRKKKKTPSSSGDTSDTISSSSNAGRRRNRRTSYNQISVRNYQSSGRCGRENEIFQRCGTDCGKTCNKIRENKYCKANSVCRSGCFCVNGYVRDDYGACITRNQCTIDYSKCGKNKKHVKCGNNCNTLCADIVTPGHRVCDQKKCLEGCFCINGMFLNSKDQCVPPKQCFN